VKKIALAAPCYGPRDPYIDKSLRLAMMSVYPVAQWVADVSSIRQGWVMGRNNAVRELLENKIECDGIVWVDDDVRLPQSAIRRLLSYDLDFVTGIVYQKEPEFLPLVADWTGRGYQFWRTYPENVLAPARGCGFGICYTSTKMLREIDTLPRQAKKGGVYCPEGGWFDLFPPDWFGSGTNSPMSEDLSFCRRAMEAGFQLYADTGLECPHYRGPEFSTKKNADQYWAKKRAEWEAAKERVDAEGFDHRGGQQAGSVGPDAERGNAGDRDAGSRSAA
jgi:hypothetical protein